MVIHTSVLHRLDALKSWTIYSFALPLMSGEMRSGLLIQLKSGEGNEKWAEASPLPGRSSETLDQAKEQLCDYFAGKAPAELFPSVQFAVENLFAAPLTNVTAHLYALLSGPVDATLKQAEIAAAQGYSTVKVKISSFSIAEAQKVLKALQPRFRLRVDCNRKFSLDEAIALFAPFDPAVFDYIEDPTYEIERLPAFTHPFALDEIVADYHTLPLESYSQLAAFILKPTLLGGIKGCTPFVNFARQRNIRIVFSPAFESGLGLLQILNVARHFDALGDLIGLDTYRYLKNDVLNPSIDFCTAKLTIAKVPYIHLPLLSEIAHGTTRMPYL